MAGLLIFPGAMPSRSRQGRAVIARLRFYVSGTTTPKAVYANEALTTPLSQPIVTDDAGRFPLIWADEDEEYTAAWSTDDGQTRSVDGLTVSMAADISINADATAAVEAAQAVLAGYSGSIRFTFDASTADADPGAGLLRLNNADVTAAVYAFIDEADANGVDATDFLDSFDDANSSANRGLIIIRNLADPAQFAVFQVSGAVVDGTGYRRVPITFLAGSTAIDDEANLAVSFSPSGPTGVTGDNAWTPTLAVVSDGARRVLQVTAWTGGEGAEPTSGVYVGASGFEALIANGVDIRGAIGISGPGTGDLLSANNLSDIASALTARTNLGLGTGAVLDTGTGANQLVKRDGSGKYPAGDGSALTNLIPDTWTVNTQAAGYTILAADKGKAVTSSNTGAATWAVTASATLGNGWWAPLHNAGTDIITLNPNGSETVDGRLTIKIYPGERFFLRCDGSNLFTVGRAGRVLVETINAAGLSSVDLEVALSDPECAFMDFEADGLTLSSTSLTARFKQSGSYVSSSSYSYVHSTATGMVAASSQAFVLLLSGSATGASGAGRIISPFNTSAFGPKFLYDIFSSGNDLVSGGSKLATAAALQGFQLLANVGTFGAGTVRSYINRT